MEGTELTPDSRRRK